MGTSHNRDEPDNRVWAFRGGNGWHDLWGDNPGW